MELTEANDTDIALLMTWFGDARATREWGGPTFRYPFNDVTFREDVQVDTLDSFVARSAIGDLIAFGQVREKLDRGHIARLAVAPHHRGRGLGSSLVKSLSDKASELFGCSDHSLFVSRSNAVALRCYERLGFREARYPRNDGQEKEIMFMVRSGH
jgi:ribosomal protein S18 acetylase RimI-like enzyme